MALREPETKEMEHHREKAAELIPESIVDEGFDLLVEEVCQENNQPLAASLIANLATEALEDPYFAAGDHYKIHTNGSVLYTSEPGHQPEKYGDVGYLVVADAYFGVEGLDRDDVRWNIIGEAIKLVDILEEEYEKRPVEA